MDLFIRFEAEAFAAAAAILGLQGLGCQSQAATLLQHDCHQLGGAVLEVAELVIPLGKAQPNLPLIKGRRP